MRPPALLLLLPGLVVADHREKQIDALAQPSLDHGRLVGLGSGVHDGRSHRVLRLGPAPYLSDDQLRDAIAALGESVPVR